MLIFTSAAFQKFNSISFLDFPIFDYFERLQRFCVAILALVRFAPYADTKKHKKKTKIVRINDRKKTNNDRCYLTLKGRKHTYIQLQNLNSTLPPLLRFHRTGEQQTCLHGSASFGHKNDVYKTTVKERRATSLQRTLMSQKIVFKGAGDQLTRMMKKYFVLQTFLLETLASFQKDSFVTLI